MSLSGFVGHPGRGLSRREIRTAQPLARIEERVLPGAASDRTVLSPVAVCEFAERLGRSSDGLERTFAGYLDSAAGYLQRETRCYFRTHEISLWMDFPPSMEGRRDYTASITVGPDWPTGMRAVTLRRGPVSEFQDAITYNDDDVATTMDSTTYRVDMVDERRAARFVLKDSGSWPTSLRDINSIELRYKCGFGDNGAKTPQEIRDAVIRMALWSYRNRGDCNCGGNMNAAKASGAMSLIEKWRRYS